MAQDRPVNPNPNPNPNDGAGGDQVPAAPITMREYLQLDARAEPVVEESDAIRTANTATENDVLIMPPAHSALATSTVNLMDAYPALVKLSSRMRKMDEEDSYNEETAALGSLTESEYLIIPAHPPHPTIPDDEVGTNKAENHFSSDYLWGVYVLNKSLLQDPSNDNDVKFGLARMEAVKLGWWKEKDQRETMRLPIPADFYDTVAADEKKIRKYSSVARDAAWLVPFANEHTFRTKGHNYIKGQGQGQGNGNIFRAARKPEICSYLPADVLYHKAFHWISPARTWSILKLNQDSNLIPAAIKVRMSNGPAGAAIVTTSAAVMRSMSIKSSGVYDEIVKANMYDIDGILALDLKIRANPTKYHRLPGVYEMPPLAGDDLEELNRMKEEAERFGPFGQAFCDIMLKNDPLSKQKVLTKASQANPVGPVVYHRAKRFLIGEQRETKRSVEEMFARKRKSDGPPNAIDDED